MDAAWRRFWAKVDAHPGGCWLWTAGRFSNGYGLFSLGGKPRRNALAHRWLYERLVGPVPEGLDLDHLCRVRHCVNPAHLEPVTRSVNLQRGAKRPPQELCKRGHALSEDNVHINPAGARVCRVCRLERSRAARGRALEDPGAAAELRRRDAAYARASRARKRGGQLAVPNSDKTHCVHGHPLSGDNLVLIDGARRCRQCRREASRRAYRKRKDLE